jgi:tight adherence protein B
MSAVVLLLTGGVALAGFTIFWERRQASRRERYAGMEKRLAALRGELVVAGPASVAAAAAPIRGGSFHMPRSVAVVMARAGVELNLRNAAIPTAVALFAAALGFLVAGPIAAAAAMSAVAIAFAFALRYTAAARMRQFIDDLPAFLDSARQLLIAGYSLPQALMRAIDGAAPSVQRYLRPLERRVANGAPLPESLSLSAEKLDCRELFVLAIIVRTNMLVGGRMSHILANVAGVLRDGARVQRELRAVTAETRYSAYAIALTPLVAVAVISFINPDYVPFFFETEQGRRLGLIALGFEISGLLVCRRILRLEY